MIILCEKKYAEGLLLKGFKKNMSFIDLSILAKYFKYIGKNKAQIRDGLLLFCHQYGIDFNEVLFDKRVRSAANSSDKYKLRVFEPIGITGKEIESIRSVSDYRHQKILFVILVISKLLSSSDRQEYYINIPFTEILRIAKVSLSVSDRNALMLAFNKCGLLTATLNGTFKLNYVDSEQKNFTITVDNEEDIVSFFPFTCSICGEETLRTGRNHRLCKSCWKEHRKEWDRNRKIPLL